MVLIVNHMKYVIISFRDGVLIPIVFAEKFSHVAIKKLEDKSVKVVSAGFCEKTDFGFEVDNTRPYSESLNIETFNIHRDEEILNEGIYNGNVSCICYADEYKLKGAPRAIDNRRHMPFATAFVRDIKTLKENEVFVFGSNTEGKHLGGAARIAHDQFGAEWGVAEGTTGQTYAIPTMHTNGARVSINTLSDSLARFIETVREESDKRFYLTAIGCGIAGWSEEEVTYLLQSVLRENDHELYLEGTYLPSNLIITKRFSDLWEY